MKRIVLILIILILCVLSFSEEVEVYESEVFKASAPVLIAGILPLDFEICTTQKASLTASKAFNSRIVGELKIDYLDLDLKVKHLSESKIFKGFSLKTKLINQKIKTKDDGLKTNYFVSSSFEKIVSMIKPEFVLVKTETSPLNFTYTLSDIGEFYRAEYCTINTEKKGKGEKYHINPSSKSNKNVLHIVRKKNDENDNAKTEFYTLIVVVTTPMSQVFNVFSQKDTYVILEGNGIRKEKNLGKLSGATPEEVIFENIPKGTYTLKLKWGNKVYNKIISVPEDLHVDFMINF